MSLLAFLRKLRCITPALAPALTRSAVRLLLLSAAGLLAACASAPPGGLDLTPVVQRASPSPLPEGWQHGGLMEIFVRGYADSDGDGLGDLRGLISKLDYLQALGVSGLWLMPITASADHDHGYAATDFRRIEPAYGSLADFDELIQQAHARGIGVIIDYMVNHSAAASPLFQASAADASGPWRDWYVWQKTAPSGWDIWGKNPWYPHASGSYFATFGVDMPDFNLRHPPALNYHLDSLRFWLNRGLDGFRLDAVPHLVENNARDWNDQPESRALTRQLRDLVQSYPGRHVVCEATAEPKVYAHAQLCGSAFAFGLESALVKAALGEAEAVRAVADYFGTDSDTDAYTARMGVFVSNHDQFAGRRLWDQLAGDEAAYRLSAATYLLLPGTPYLYYGEEIGQAGATGLTGDPEIRAPMSWSADTRTAGFTRGQPFRPPASNVATHNVAAQLADPHSLLAHYRGLLTLRKALPSIARGSWLRPVADGATLSFQRRLGTEHTVMTYNYARQPQTLAVQGLPAGARLQALLPGQAQALQADASGGVQVPLAAQSFAVWRVQSADALASAASTGQAAAVSPAAATCRPAPLGDTTLYLRGSMNQWQPDEAYALAYHCDAYRLNLKLSGQHRFKIADDSWTASTVLANAPGHNGAGLPALLSVGTNTAELQLDFAGDQVLRLAFDATGPRLSLSAGQFDDPKRSPITDPVALSLRHDSRALTDKQPFGAVPAGTTLQWGLSALPGVEQATLVIERRHLGGDQTVLAYTPLARLPLQRTPGTAPGTERFSTTYRFDQIGVYGYWFEVRIAGETYLLQNNNDTIAWTREKGSNGPAAVTRPPEQTRHIRRLRQTVYAPGFTVPSWAADAVYYSIFPERFRNGDPANDPRPGRATYHDQAVEQHPRWLDLPYKPGSGDGSDATYNNDFFGGDLAGIIDKLDYIRDLGANAIYMTPIFQAASNHKYDTADYQQIDPGFGSNADFLRLTREAARRGIRLVMDASFNHTGSDSRYFDRYGKFTADGNVGAFAGGQVQPKSPWASWYRFSPSEHSQGLPYTGWSGVADLPELDKTAPAWRDFAYRTPDSVTRSWLQRGAAGWRMDVAPWVPDDFWREWRTVVKQTDPEAITIAETWFDASKHLLGDMFDATMNYIFRSAVLDYAAGGPAPASVAQLELVRELYPPPAYHALMNLLSSHDVARALHRLGDTHLGGPAVDAATAAKARQRLRLALLFQMSYPGAPSVYYGDEVGLAGGDDPYNRAPYPWADQGGQPDLALHAELKRLIGLRQTHPVLRRGELLAPLWVDEHLIVLARRLGEGATAAWSITATNNSEQARSVTLRLPPGLPAQRLRDSLTEGLTPAASLQPVGDQLTLSVPALYGRLLLVD